MWKRISGGLLVFWTPIERILQWAEHADFITNSIGHLPMLSAPAWAAIVAPIIGVGLIVWDIWDRKRVRPPVDRDTRIAEKLWPTPNLWSRIKRYFTSSAEEESVRMPLVELYQQAKNYGVNFIRQEHSILKFTNAVRQSAVDGTLDFWGRQHKHMFEELNRREPLIRIPTSHWHDFRPDWVTAVVLEMNQGSILGFQNDNFPFRSYIPGGSGGRNGFYDLHIDQLQANKWLRAIKPNDFSTP